MPAAAVGETDVPAVEALDRGYDDDVTGLQRVEEPDVDQRDRVVATEPLIETVVRRRESVCGEIADVHPADRRRDGVEESSRHLPEQNAESQRRDAVFFPEHDVR